MLNQLLLRTARPFDNAVVLAGTHTPSAAFTVTLKMPEEHDQPVRHAIDDGLTSPAPFCNPEVGGW